MKVNYSDKVREPDQDFRLLREASTRLQEIVAGPAEEDVAANWDRAPDGKYSLTLQDHWGQVNTQFSAEDLDSSRYSRHRLLQTWNDLLGVRLRKMVENLQRD